jgi:hypothetical protein
MTTSEVKVPYLSSPSLPGLSFLLRHEELWPEKFKWNYFNPNFCAIGLTQQYWKNNPKYKGELYSAYMARIFDMREDYAFRIFTTLNASSILYILSFGMWKKFVPPSAEEVADKIDEYLSIHH